MAGNIRWDISSIVEGLKQLRLKTEAAILTYGNTQATKLESYAKQNAPWTDRTGDARRRLSCKCEKVDSGIRLTLSHGVDYGLWLEIAKEKRYAIIEPTIRLKSQDVMAGFANLMEGLGMSKV